MHSVIISADGKIFTWGRGGSGQLGIGECPDQVQSPTRVKALESELLLMGAAFEWPVTPRFK